MEGIAAIAGLLILVVAAVGACVWGLTRRSDAQRDASEEKEGAVRRVAKALRTRVHGAELLRSLRGGGKEGK